MVTHKEPEVISDGKCSLKQVMKFLTDHQASPYLINAEHISKEYKISQTVTGMYTSFGFYSGSNVFFSHFFQIKIVIKFKNKFQKKGWKLHLDQKLHFLKLKIFFGTKMRPIFYAVKLFIGTRPLLKIRRYLCPLIS